MKEELFERLSGIADEELPRIAKIHWHRPSLEIENLEDHIKSELERLDLLTKINSGAEIGITAGSRGISNIARIIKTVVQYLQAIGAKPFIFPSMGSHGGATAPGQVAVLKKLGIAEETIGCLIRATMETVEPGQTPNGISVFVDQYAAAADGIFVINRVKPHTAFSGQIGSGLLKMMAIGMGKQKGAKTIHRWAFGLGLEQVILEVSQVMLEKLPILGGLAIVEGFHHETALLKAVERKEFLSWEKELLKRAGELMPILPFDELDILIVDEMGKDISGTGMDTQVIGRQYILGEPEPPTPRIKRIYLRSLAPGSGGNAFGIGLADFVHRRVVEAMDREQTYINALSGTGPEKARIPPHFENDRTALKLCLSSIGYIKPSEAHLVWIKNTRDLAQFYISEGLLDGVRKNPELEQAGEIAAMVFDSASDFNDELYFGHR